MTDRLEREKAIAVAAARAAGTVIRTVYETQYRVDYKHDHSPVTVADRQANHRIHQIIHHAFPHDGWLSEETTDSPDRLSKRRVWVVDPLDGTQEFIDKIPEFAVSIGLIEDGRPLLGVIYYPALDELIWAARGQGAWYRTGDAGDTRLHVSPTERLAEATVLASRSETQRGEWHPFRSLFRARPAGGMAHKLAAIAKGEADATFTLVPKNEWDLGAGAMLVEEAGGLLTTLGGRPVVFNQATTLLQGLIASNRFLHPQLMAVVAPHLSERHRTELRL